MGHQSRRNPGGDVVTLSTVTARRIGGTTDSNPRPQATPGTKRLAPDKLVDAILPTGILPKTNLAQ